MINKVAMNGKKSKKEKKKTPSSRSVHITQIYPFNLFVSQINLMVSILHSFRQKNSQFKI